MGTFLLPGIVAFNISLSAIEIRNWGWIQGTGLLVHVVSSSGPVYQSLSGLAKAMLRLSTGVIQERVFLEFQVSCLYEM